MKILLIPLVALAFYSLYSCDKDDSDLDVEVPICIEGKIDSILSMPVDNPATQVWTWVDDVNTYYCFTPGCCDEYSELYNDDCQYLCSPDGGISGNGTGNCPTFQGTVVKTKIWEDPRN